MKFKSIAAAAILLFTLASSANDAGADEYCSLSVSKSYVLIGKSYSYGVTINPHPPGPLPGPIAAPVFTVVFHGTKDGEEDTPPEGEAYPASFDYGHYDLTGYFNPGGYSGTYSRYAEIRTQYGNTYCTTNSVTVVLELRGCLPRREAVGRRAPTGLVRFGAWGALTAFAWPPFSA